MDVFDSNVWIYGLTKTCAQASNYVDQVIRHDRRVAVSAYIYDEVMRNLDRSQHGHEEIDRVKTRFAEILYDNGRIEAPSDEEVRAMDIDEMRSDPAVQAMGAGFDIQPKDVPILVFASQVSNRVTPQTNLS